MKKGAESCQIFWHEVIPYGVKYRVSVLSTTLGYYVLWYMKNGTIQVYTKTYRISIWMNSRIENTSQMTIFSNNI